MAKTKVKPKRKYTKRVKPNSSVNATVLMGSSILKTKKTEDFTCELVDEIPRRRFGLTESQYNHLIKNLSHLKPNKNSINVSISYKNIAGRIIKDIYPNYAVKYSNNVEKDICSIWRTA